MGILEKEIKVKDKRKNIQKIILNTVFITGMLSVALVAPNIISAIKKMGGFSKRKKNLKYSINSSFTRLQEKGLISLLKVDFKIGKDILYMVVEKLENDWPLRKAFGLPNSDGRKS